ncbi:MAG TPA: MCE family protein [Nocardioidaceae bacterium]|nr:MCE family protein [Nocardioidaceae bacterium]
MINRQSRAFRAAVTIEHRVFGVAFLALLMLATWFTYAVFNKSFAEYDEVTLRASKTGLQLPDRADVKLRGVIVGEVVGARTTAEGVTLTLGLYPSRRESVPADVTAEIIPKTLFGEKYVALQVPEGSPLEPISPGHVIEEAAHSIEVEQVLNDIYPLLRAVQPAEINYTLTAMATALEGRGQAIGENFSVLNDYLKRTNPQIPELVEDLRMLSEVSDVYRSVIPEVARLLRNSVTSGNTFMQKEQKIQALFADVAAFSSTSKDFLESNGDNIIRLGELSAQQLPLYAKYAPQYPCLFYGIVKAAPRQAETLRGYTLHITLETLPKQPRGYGVQDDAVYGDKRGPIDEEHCWESYRDEKWNQNNLPPASMVPDIVDGVDESTGKHRPAPLLDPSSGFAGTAAERGVVNSVAAPVLGIPVDSVPDVASLLFGPLARGMEVELR